MEYSKIKITKMDAPVRTAFENLAVGDWYESPNGHGLCIKTGHNTTLRLKSRCHVTLEPGREREVCTPVNVEIKYR